MGFNVLDVLCCINLLMMVLMMQFDDIDFIIMLLKVLIKKILLPKLLWRDLKTGSKHQAPKFWCANLLFILFRTKRI